MKKRLPKDVYAQIVASIPVLCVDLLISYPGKEGVLLVLRKNEPLAGMLWPPGGRVLRGETIKEAAHRLAKEELGIEIKLGKVAGYYEEYFPKSAANMKTGIHTVSIVYRAKTISKKVKLDAQSSEWTCGEIPEKFIFNLEEVC